MAKRWFDIATDLKSVSTKAFDAIGEVTGRRPRKQKVCTLRKVAKFPEDLGKLLDDVGVKWPLIEWIAHASTPQERDERARMAIRAALDEQATKTHPDRLKKAVCRDYLGRSVA